MFKNLAILGCLFPHSHSVFSFSVFKSTDSSVWRTLAPFSLVNSSLICMSWFSHHFLWQVFFKHTDTSGTEQLQRHVIGRDIFMTLALKLDWRVPTLFKSPKGVFFFFFKDSPPWFHDSLIHSFLLCYVVYWNKIFSHVMPFCLMYIDLLWSNFWSMLALLCYYGIVRNPITYEMMQLCRS